MEKNNITCGWVEKEMVLDDDIIEKLKTYDTISVQLENQRNGGTETPYGFFVDLIRDNFPVTLFQCDRVARYLAENMTKIKFVLVGQQCDDLLFGGVYDTLKEAKERIVEIVSDRYSDWWDDADQDGTLTDYINDNFRGDFYWYDDSEDGIEWKIIVTEEDLKHFAD